MLDPVDTVVLGSIECKYSRKGERQARAKFISLSDPNIEALNAYDDLYYELDFKNESTNDSQDFHEPLQSSDWQIKSEDESRLEGNQEKVMTLAPKSSETFHAVTQKPALHLGQDLTNSRKFLLNQAMRRNLARNISKVYHTISRTEDPEAPLVELHKYMARPPGCSFLGASAAHVLVSVNSLTENPSDIIINSRSDITLILEKALKGLLEAPKIKKGQKINLVQVTGKASLNMLSWNYIFAPKKDWSKLRSKLM